MTQLSEKEHNAQMADMKTYDEQMPSVGCFQYDSVAHVLCEVQKQELTPLMVESARKRGENQIKIEYGVVSLPQSGSVVWDTDKFIVLVGKWAEPIQEELSELLESSRCRTLNLCTMSTGTWGTVGVVICQSKCPGRPRGQVIETYG